MVTKPNTSVPPAPTGLRPNPTKIEPPKMVSGNGVVKHSGEDVANKDRSGQNTFKLPDKISAAEVRDQSFRYGGGRSAGNRSLADNAVKKVFEP